MNAYIPLVLITDNNMPNALKLAQHVTDMVSDFNTVGDVSAYVKLATAPPGVSPTGKGIFIWQLKNTAAGDPAAAVRLARSAGLSWVAVKIHDGTTIDDSQALKDFVAAFHAAHVQVYGWGYCYLRLAQAEANAAVLQAQNLSLDGYIIDAEGEAAAAGSGPAEQFATIVRSGIHKPIGLSSYRYPSLHMDLPWHELLSVCTFHCPQVYWLASAGPLTPGSQLDRCVRELINLSALPVVPIGCAFSWTPQGGAEWRPTVAQLQNFIEAARLHGATIPAYAWWSWESASAHPDWWAAIAGAAVG
jgi:hypothetical protein